MNTLTVQNDIESTVRKTWAEVLRVREDAISSHANFFLLGGDSLSMAQVLVRLQEKLSIKLKLNELFKLSSVSKMAKHCSKLTSYQSYPASAAQCGLWYIHQLHDEQRVLYNTSVILNFNGLLKFDALQQALTAISVKHGTLRSRFHFNWRENELRVLEAEPTEIALNIKTITYDALGKELENFCQYQFDLENDSLFRVKLFKINQEKYALLICIHHIVTDGWSGGVFLEELKYYYEQYKQERKCRIIPLKAEYADYCNWQHQQIQLSAFDAKIEYWRTQLENLPVRRSPLKKDDKLKRSSYDSALLSFNISGDIFDKLKVLAANESATLFMVNLTVFNIVLSMNMAENDIVIGIPVANRKFSKWEQVCGYFVNTIALRNVIDHSDPFKVKLNKIKESTLEAFHYQDVPLQELVKALKPGIKENPFFDILFAYQNSPNELPVFQNLMVTLKKVRNSKNHYALGVEIFENADSLSVNLEYSTELYDELAMQKILQAYQNILSELTC